MADRIKVTTDVLHEVAHDLSGMRDEVFESARMLARVDTSREAGGDLRLNWSHTLPDRTRVSGRNVGDFTRSLLRALNDLGNEIGALSDMVTRTARSFEQTENENTESFGGIDGVSGHADYEAKSGRWDASGNTGRYTADWIWDAPIRTGREANEWIWDAASHASREGKDWLWDESSQAAAKDWIWDAAQEAKDLLWDEASLAAGAGAALFTSAGLKGHGSAGGGGSRKQQREAREEKQRQEYLLHDAAMANAVRMAVNQHRSEWDGASPDRRTEIIKMTVSQINAIQGTHVEFRTDWIAKLRYSKTDMIGEYRRDENAITVDPDKIKSGRYISVIGTVVHEMRHAYQHSVVSKKNKNFVPGSVRREWESNFAKYTRGPELDDPNHEELLQNYMRQPLEADAYSWERSIVMSGLEFSSEMDGLRARAADLEKARAAILGKELPQADSADAGMPLENIADKADEGAPLENIADKAGEGSPLDNIAEKDFSDKDSAGEASPLADLKGKDMAKEDDAAADSLRAQITSKDLKSK